MKIETIKNKMIIVRMKRLSPQETFSIFMMIMMMMTHLLVLQIMF